MNSLPSIPQAGDSGIVGRMPAGVKRRVPALTPSATEGSLLHQAGVPSGGTRMYPTGIAVKPISPRSRDLRRFGVLSLSLLQLAVFAGLPTADAVLEARGLSTVVHIEGENSEDCETGHNHLMCQLTRTLSSGFSPFALIDLPLVFEASMDTPTATAWQKRPIPPGGSGPRAPPRA